MHITIDTNALTEADRRLLATLLADAKLAPVAQEAAPKEAAKAAKEAAPKAAKAAPKAEAAAAVAAPEEPVLEPETGDQPSMGDVVALATKLVADGRADDVRTALKGIGVKRVSELPEDRLGEFVAALS